MTAKPSSSERVNGDVEVRVGDVKRINLGFCHNNGGVDTMLRCRSREKEEKEKGS